jgi:hypothetical protein
MIVDNFMMRPMVAGTRVDSSMSTSSGVLLAIGFSLRGFVGVHAVDVALDIAEMMAAKRALALEDALAEPRDVTLGGAQGRLRSIGPGSLRRDPITLPVEFILEALLLGVATVDERVPEGAVHALLVVPGGLDVEILRDRHVDPAPAGRDGQGTGVGESAGGHVLSLSRW